jgi:HEPN domain-containing protein
LNIVNTIAAHEHDYVVWQNRALRFYLAFRVLHRRALYAPAAYCAAMAIELLLKATLIYWDRSFSPLDAGHGMAKLARMVANAAPGADGFSVPRYFYHEQHYLTVSRYPTAGKGLVIPSSFLDDLDSVFADLVLFVPFQHNTELKHALRGEDRSVLNALRSGNRHVRRLRSALAVSLG